MLDAKLKKIIFCKFSRKSKKMQVSNQRDTFQSMLSLNTEYMQEEFIAILKDFCSELLLKPPQKLPDFFRKIVLEKGRVTGEDIMQILEQLKSQSQQSTALRDQINYYKEKIYSHKLKNIDDLKKSEFMKQFVEKSLVKGYITELIAEKLQNTNIVSLRKVEVFIGHLEQIYEQNKKLKLPKRKTSIRKSSVRVGFDKSSIIENMLLDFQKKFKDQSIIQGFEQFYEKLKNMEQEYKQQEIFFEKSEYFLKKQIEKKDDIITNYEKTIEQKNEQMNCLQKKYESLEKEYDSLFCEKADLLQYIQRIEEERECIFKEKKELQKKQKQVEQELQLQRKIFKNLHDQYWKYVGKSQEELIRLYEEIDQLKKKNIQMENQFERGLDETAKNFQTDASFYSPEYSLKKYFDSPVHDISSALSISQTNLGFLKHKFEEEKIAGTLQASICKVKQKIHEYDQIGVLQTQKFKPIMNVLYDQKKQQEGYLDQPQKKTDFYSSTGYFIEESGNRHYFGVIVVNGRLAFLDSKCRLNFILGFDQIKKILICFYNVSWVVIKVREKQENTKGTAIKGDMVLSLANRLQFLSYLRKFKDSLEKYGTKVEVEKQENIWLRRQNKQCLLSSFNNCYNNYLLSVSNCKDMFDVSIKDNNSFLSLNSIFNFESNRILMVTKLGLLVFESDRPQDLEKKQNLFYLLPLVEKMEVIQLENELKLSYEVEKKSYRIKAKSKALAHKLKRKIEEQREENLREKKWELKRQEASFKE